jgi:tetratricopeptide (TPR) repeat protein
MRQEKRNVLKIVIGGAYFESTHAVAFALAVFLIWAPIQQARGQGTELDKEILKYEAVVRQKPDDAKAHRDLGRSYARKGMTDEAISEFEKAMKIEYNRGYEDGREDAIRREGVRFYGTYLVLSIAVGLFIAAVIVSILSWSEIADKFRTIRKNARIKAFVRDINVRLSPDLQNRAVEIARSKEKLCDAIGRETDSSLKEAASGVLPRLEDLTRQASLLLGLQQNLTDYIKDIDPAKLDISQRECEEKLRKETDQEAKRALEYELKQIKNKQANYAKAKAKIRTCDAVLSGIAARIDATSLDLMSLPSIQLKKQEFFEKVSVELDEEISLTRDAAETVMEEST